MAFDFNGKGNYGGNSYGDDGADYTKDSYDYNSSEYGGFQNPPGINDASPYGSSDSYQSGYDADNYYNYPASYPGHSGKTHKYPHQRRMPQGSSTIPIKAILIVVAIITGIVLCVVFRDEITQFIAQLLAWIIVICIAVIALRLLFRRRR